MDKRNILFGFAAIALMIVSMNGLTFAADAGSAGANLLGTVTDMLSGSIGTIIGLGLAFLGLWTWIVKQETAAGITMILGGVALTMLPQVFEGAKGVVGGVLTQFGSTN